MTTYNDAKLTALELQTELIGDINDLYHVWLLTQLGGNSNTLHLNDMELQWLEQVTSATGTVQDLWVRYLNSLGYTGHVNDMLLEFWVDRQTPPVAPPGAPLNVQGTGFFDPPGRVELTWDASVPGDAPINFYNIERDDQFLSQSPVNSYSDTDNLLPDTAYQYRVQAIDTNGVASDQSAPANVAIPNLILAAAPTGLAGDDPGGQSALRVTWVAAVAGSFPVASYNIWRNNDLIANTGTPVLEFTDNPGVAGNYNYHVSAIDTDDNEGALSTQLVVGEWPVNIYLNQQLAGGAASGPGPGSNPPTSHTIGFNTNNSHPIDIGGGFFEWHSNPEAVSGRTYLTYTIHVLHPDLEIGVQYEFLLPTRRPAGNNTALISVAGITDMTVTNILRNAQAEETILSILITPTQVGYQGSLRWGNGITSSQTSYTVGNRPILRKLATP